MLYIRTELYLHTSMLDNCGNQTQGKYPEEENLQSTRCNCYIHYQVVRVQLFAM
jgi:hypothetical protein